MPSGGVHPISFQCKLPSRERLLHDRIWSTAAASAIDMFWDKRAFPVSRPQRQVHHQNPTFDEQSTAQELRTQSANFGVMG